MKHALSLAAVALTATFAAPAQAADVTVSLAISAGTYAPTGIACQLTVPAGADGLTVLSAAVSKACITSYEATSYPGFGTFVTCIDNVCGNAGTGTVGTYWNMYENGGSTGYGVDAFSAEPGDELGFAYQAFCFAAVCPPGV